MSILANGYMPAINDTVLAKTGSGRVQGIIRYIGKIDGSKKTRYGLELLKPTGDHNGTYKGKQYFKCPKNHGIIVKRSSIIKKLKSTLSQSLSKTKSQKKILQIANNTFERIQKIIFHLIRSTLLSNTTLIDSNIISLIYIYSDPYDFQFVVECRRNSEYISWSTVKKAVISNQNDSGCFGIILLGYNGLFPFPEWNLVHIPKESIMEYKCSFIIQNQMKANNHINNGYFGIAIVSEGFYHFSSLKGINKQKKKRKNKNKSKLFYIIHDNAFRQNIMEQCLAVPTKYYGDYEPITVGFNFPLHRMITFKIQCKKYIAKETKQRIEWKSRIIIECDQHVFMKNIGSTQKVKRCRIGLVLFAPDSDYNGVYKCKAHIQNQEVNQLCNVNW